ncbi:retrovirus-related pol polyprotein from transposon TNT 1-94 [Tanacetum coccineum]|uniref:Retrovirus-related pol polyprotein from transposon TNT 1-94 n=1 Tax=Tanacetum coccineum TaxID=301880 RepID=A0ABQ5G091_9ASTR
MHLSIRRHVRSSVVPPDSLLSCCLLLYVQAKDQDIKLKSQDIKLKTRIQDHKHAKGTSKEFPRTQGSKTQDVTRSEAIRSMNGDIVGLTYDSDILSELSAEQVYWSPVSKPTPSVLVVKPTPTKVFPKKLPTTSMVKWNLQKAKDHLDKFNACIKNRTVLSDIQVGNWGVMHIKWAFEEDVIPFFKNIVEIVLWYLDSGYSKHMTGQRDKLINFNLSNQTLRAYTDDVGITHHTSIARTPQQNDVVEWRNGTPDNEAEDA